MNKFVKWVDLTNFVFKFCMYGIMGFGQINKTLKY